MQHTTDKEIRILEYFYNNQIGHVRQIESITKLPKHTLLKYLETLSTKKIIFSKKQGNQKIFELNYENKIIKIFFAYFDNLRLERLEYKRKTAITEFIKKTKEILPTYFILLFGSSAKNNYSKQSDIDLIIISNHKSELLKRIKEEINAEKGIKINYLIMTIEEFKKEKDNKENYALQDALKTGYPVYGEINYYETMWV